MSLAATEQRSVAELFNAALRATDEDARWDAIAALHWRGSQDVYDRAVTLCASSSSAERATGADILGQLGIPERTFADDSFAVVLKLLFDQDTDVQYSAIIALKHIDEKRAASHVIPLSRHPDERVRYAVTFALCGVDDECALHTLLTLARDEDCDVRNWATFGLGQQSDRDTPEIRQALDVGLQDQDEDVRYEAIIGLARRRDTRMTGYIKTMLHDDPDDIFARMAAARLLETEEGADTATADLLGALERQQKWARQKA